MERRTDDPGFFWSLGGFLLGASPAVALVVVGMVGYALASADAMSRTVRQDAGFAGLAFLVMSPILALAWLAALAVGVLVATLVGGALGRWLVRAQYRAGVTLPVVPALGYVAVIVAVVCVQSVWRAPSSPKRTAVGQTFSPPPSQPSPHTQPDAVAAAAKTSEAAALQTHYGRVLYPGARIATVQPGPTGAPLGAVRTLPADSDVRLVVAYYERLLGPAERTRWGWKWRFTRGGDNRQTNLIVAEQGGIVNAAFLAE